MGLRLFIQVFTNEVYGINYDDVSPGPRLGGARTRLYKDSDLVRRIFVGYWLFLH